MGASGWPDQGISPCFQLRREGNGHQRSKKSKLASLLFRRVWQWGILVLLGLFHNMWSQTHRPSDLASALLAENCCYADRAIVKDQTCEKFCGPAE